MTRILVTSASGANGDGYGAILSFTADGVMTGPFSRDRRISDPRGLSLGPSGEPVYVNSGDDRVLALDGHGKVAFDSGRIDGLDPGGGTFGPGDRYYVGPRRCLRFRHGKLYRRSSAPVTAQRPGSGPCALAVRRNGVAWIVDRLWSPRWPPPLRHRDNGARRRTLRGCRVLTDCPMMLVCSPR